MIQNLTGDLGLYAGASLALSITAAGRVSISTPLSLTRQLTVNGLSMDTAVIVTSAGPGIGGINTAAAANAKVWVRYYDVADMYDYISNDAGSTTSVFFQATRNAAAITALAWGSTTDNPTYEFKGTGNVQFGGSTTGAQTATFIATNKPGSGTAGPIAWIPVKTAGGTQGYVPVFGA